jgi:ADP-heptose:LPS heptosyltransferase
MIETRTPAKCLVIQLARLGDTLQSLMALRAAKQLYPHLEIHFLVRESFADAARRVPWIKHVYTLPSQDLLAPILSGSRTLTDTLPELEKWIAPIRAESWQYLINWTFSEASSYLTALIPAQIKLGYTRGSDHTMQGTDGWSHYIQAIVQGKIPQNIHLTDVFTTQLLTALQIHDGEPANQGHAAVTSKNFFSLTLTETEIAQISCDSRKRWIGLQIGASRDSKTLSPRKWAQFVEYFLERNQEYGIFLLGGKSDKTREQEFIAELSPNAQAWLQKKVIVSFVGESTFDLWASLLSRCQWLISGDTAAIHLASLLGTRVINLSLGEVSYAETGPYGNGHYVVRPTHSDIPITPQVIYSTWTYANSEWAHKKQTTLEEHFSHLNGSHVLEGVEIYRSKIRPTAEGGGVNFEPMIRRPLSLNLWTSRVMGHIARAWYCGWIPEITQEISREQIAPELLQMIRQYEESSEVLSKICVQASRIANTIHTKSLSLKSTKIMRLQEKEELQDLANKLQELEELIVRLGRTHSPILAFSQMLKVLLQHLQGDHLVELGRDTSLVYRHILEGVNIFKSWVKFTLQLGKPVALQPKLVPVSELHVHRSGKDLSP